MKSKNKKDLKENRLGYYFGCLKCKMDYIHQSKMKKDNLGIIICPICGHTKFIMRYGRPYFFKKKENGVLHENKGKKILFTVRPNQNTRRYFMYYVSKKQNKQIEAKLMQVAVDRGYTGRADGYNHEIIFKNKDQVRGSDFIIL